MLLLHAADTLRHYRHVIHVQRHAAAIHYVDAVCCRHVIIYAYLIRAMTFHAATPPLLYAAYDVLMLMLCHAADAAAIRCHTRCLIAATILHVSSPFTAAAA